MYELGRRGTRSCRSFSQRSLSSHSLSNRPATNGIQPTWPSLNTIFNDLNRSSSPDASQSPMANSAFWKLMDLPTNGGTSLPRGSPNLDDDPMCMLTTVSVSSQAAHTGSQ